MLRRKNSKCNATSIRLKNYGSFYFGSLDFVFHCDFSRQSFFDDRRRCFFLDKISFTLVARKFQAWPLDDERVDSDSVYFQFIHNATRRSAYKFNVARNGSLFQSR